MSTAEPIEAISLFSGIGGFDLGFDQVFGSAGRIIQFVEIDPDAIAVLRTRFPRIPIHHDIKTYYPPTNWGGVLYGGFPCVGTSSAGKREGLNHPESNLWFEMLRIIIQCQPKFVVIENPEGLIHRGLRAVLGGLRMAGYCWEDPQLISAAWLGSPQQRNRLFIIAYPDYLRQRFGEMPTSWGDQIGAELEAVHCTWRQTTSSSTGVDDGLPPWLGGTCVNGWWQWSPAPAYPGMRRHTPKRRECNDLYARSVIPEQAAIALRRVLYLNRLTKNL